MIVKPLPPLDERQAKAKSARDLAGKGAWSITQVEGMLADCDEQPLWRDRADRACQFCDNVDNEQLTPLQKFEAMRNGVPARAVNLVGRVINGVLGQEARSRRDPVLEADDDELSDVCDALNVKLKEAHRETMADMAVSNAYASQVKAGIGWVEVRRNADPFQYQYAVEDIPRNEMWWDWRAKRIDLSDARWVCRAQWKDVDEVVAAFPQHREAIERAERAERERMRKAKLRASSCRVAGGPSVRGSMREFISAACRCCGGVIAPCRPFELTQARRALMSVK